MTQSVTGTALAALVAVVIQVGASTKATTFSGEQQTTGITASGLDLRYRFSKIFEHQPAYRIHHFWVIELQHGHAADKLKTHTLHIDPLNCRKTKSEITGWVQPTHLDEVSS